MGRRDVLIAAMEYEGVRADTLSEQDREVFANIGGFYALYNNGFSPSIAISFQVRPSVKKDLFNAMRWLETNRRKSLAI